MPKRKWWGWGLEDDGIDDRAFATIVESLERVLGPMPARPIDVIPADAVTLRTARFRLPGALADFATNAREDRLAHACGKSYTDLINAVSGDLPNPPDAVAYPRSEADLSALMRFAEAARIALIPYGGGTSVVGGVEPAASARYRGTISVDLRRLNAILAVDTRSRLVRAGGGTFGPALETALEPHRLTLRHFPQSFEFSTVGGWVATRAAGHFATGPTHIDDLLAGVRLVAPAGVIDVQPRGYAGGGPAPERLVLGSEGALGFVTEAWLRVHAVPRHRASATIRFEDPDTGVEAVRALAQSGLEPANCRLVSPLESAFTGLGDGQTTDLLLAFESADHPVDAAFARGREICAGLGGVEDPIDATTTRAATGRWRDWFLKAPYMRDRLALRGLVVETFETATTWTSFGILHRAVLAAVQASIEHECGRGVVTWRLTHAYPDGVAPYYTVVAVGKRGREIEQWTAIKQAALDAIEAGGGTTTHHHAIGRAHRPSYDRERGETFVGALASLKRALDPAGIMNPGVLIGDG